MFHKLSDSDDPLNHWRITSKESWGNTSVRSFLLVIRFHTQRNDGANTTSIGFPQRNGYNYYNALQKHESNGSDAGHKRRNLARRYTVTMFVNTQPRQRTRNVNRTNKRKWFHIKKGKKLMISSRNNDRCRLCRRHCAFCKYTSPIRIPTVEPGANIGRHWLLREYK